MQLELFQYLEISQLGWQLAFEAVGGEGEVA